jgi:hypothetical protein
VAGIIKAMKNPNDHIGNRTKFTVRASCMVNMVFTQRYHSPFVSGCTCS